MGARHSWTLVWILFVCVPPVLGQTPEKCVVHDPELQGSYAGSCRDGLAEGYGVAAGSAEYKGEFKAGRKHGRGIKTWPSGDRYDGEFVNDLREGTGTYTWGRHTPWAGEKYIGSYRNDWRHGQGIYEWPDGDRYSGLWENDVVAGQPTPRMYARSRAYVEHVVAVAKPGNRICKSVAIGIGIQDWVRGTVVELKDDKVAVRLDDAGRFQQTASGSNMKAGDIIWEPARSWIPCL
jgi:hypothetical protein